MEEVGSTYFTPPALWFLTFFNHLTTDKWRGVKGCIMQKEKILVNTLHIFDWEQLWKMVVGFPCLRAGAQWGVILPYTLCNINIKLHFISQDFVIDSCKLTLFLMVDENHLWWREVKCLRCSVMSLSHLLTHSL